MWKVIDETTDRPAVNDESLRNLSDDPEIELLK